MSNARLPADTADPTPFLVEFMNDVIDTALTIDFLLEAWGVAIAAPLASSPPSVIVLFNIEHSGVSLYISVVFVFVTVFSCGVTIIVPSGLSSNGSGGLSPSMEPSKETFAPSM